MKQERKSLIEDQHFPFECSDSYGVESDFQVLHWHQEIEICFMELESIVSMALLITFQEETFLSSAMMIFIYVMMIII